MAEDQADLETRLAALRASFAENLTERLDALEAALQGLDASNSLTDVLAALKEVRNIAHRLAGSGTTFGFPEVTRIARDVETLAERLLADKAAPQPSDSDRLAAFLTEFRDAARQGPADEEIDTGLAGEAPAGPAEGSPWRVLLIEDDPAQARQVEEHLRSESYVVQHVDRGKAGIAVIERDVPDAILLDLMLPDIEGIEILRMVAERQLPCVVIVVTAHGSVNLAVEAMRLGAFDFIMKPFNATRLQVTLRNALEHDRLSRIVETYQDLDRDTYHGFIGGSLAMQAVYRIIESAAGSKATVFISGESGTGKEVCAEALHRQSPRAKQPFVAINCGAIPKDLMESEIFGHVKGAFTGAISEREGAARRANGGTLFLDEVCEMDLALQTKLLRFVQTGTFQKVGGERTEEVDVRFVCATNRDPVAEMAAGRFREDLFYRLHVIPIQLPPLRERGDDMLLIAKQFLVQFAKEEHKQFSDFSPEAQNVFRSYPWPGNVRELQNVIRHIVVLNDGEIVMPEMLPPPVGSGTAADIPKPSAPAVTPRPAAVSAADMPATADTGADPAESIRPLADVEREAIDRAIRLCDGNIPRAAHFLGVSASTIYRKKQSWQEAEED